MSRDKPFVETPIASPAVGGVRMYRSPLEREAGQLMGICRKLGRRLRTYFQRIPELTPVWRGEGEDARMVLGEDGQPLMQPTMPDKDWRESLKLYSDSVTALLKEQRERAKMVAGKGGLPLTDADFEAELAQLAKDTIATMPESELQAILRQRKAIDVSVDKPVDNPPDSQPLNTTPDDEI